MRHKYNTNGKESLNMRNAEYAPKYKNFLRSPSLNWRVKNVIDVYNWGYDKFYMNLLDHLGIPSTKVMVIWLLHKEQSKLMAKEKRKLLSNKRKRIYKRNEKNKNELLAEQTKDMKLGTYGAGIGVHGKLKKR